MAMVPLIVVLGVVTAFVVVLTAKAVLIVPQAETMVVERLGQYHRTLHSGINIVWPILDKPKSIVWRYIHEEMDGRVTIKREQITKIDLRETVYDFPRQNVITKDNVLTELNALLYFQITDPVKAVYEIANLPDAIEKLAQTTLRNIIGELDLDETLASRDRINTRLRSILDEATDKWGVKINRVELQDINPPRDIRDAMEKQMRAERDKRASILEAEGYKQSQIIRAEGERQAKILHAEGEAISRMRIAQAESDSIKKLSSALEGTKEDPAHYLIAISYIEALKEMVTGKNNKVVYLPYEATGILSSIGGIKEILAGSKGFHDSDRIKRDV
jgi:regulator of protease activity HflC (stomatin/prohibitin superfamily)